MRDNSLIYEGLGSGYGVLQKCTCCISISSFSELLKTIGIIA